MGLNSSPALEQTEVDWSTVLEAAAAIARRGSTTEPELLQSLTDELRGLNLTGEVAFFNAEGQLQIRARILNPSSENALGRLMGRSIEGYAFDPAKISVFHEAFASSQPVFVSHRMDILRQITPSGLRGLTPRIMNLLGGDQPTIVTPLIASGESRNTGI